MSDHSIKLSSLAEKKKALQAEENHLIDKRKKEIGSLAEKFELLTAPDILIIGLFSEAQDALKNKSDKIKTWEHQGEIFLKPKKNHRKPAQENPE